MSNLSSKNSPYPKTMGGTLPVQYGRRHHQERPTALAAHSRRAAPSEPATPAAYNRRATPIESSANGTLNRWAGPTEVAQAAYSRRAGSTEPFSTLPRQRPQLQEKYSTDTIRQTASAGQTKKSLNLNYKNKTF